MMVKTDEQLRLSKAKLKLSHWLKAMLCVGYIPVSAASTIGITNSLGSGNVAAYNGELTIAQELLSTTNNADYLLPLNGNAAPSGNVFSKQIRYVPTYGPLTGDILTFTLNGAYLNASNLVLYAEESALGQGNLGATDINSDGDTTDVVEVASLFSTVDPISGYDTFVLRFNNGLNLPAGLEMILQTSAPIDASPSDGMIDDRTANSPTLAIRSDITTTNVTLSVTVTNLFGISIPNASAEAIIADITPQFSFNISDPGAIISNINTFPGTSIIDVSSEAGTEFTFVNENSDNDFNDSEVKQGDANDDSDAVLSAGFLTLSNDPGGVIEDTIALTAQDSFQVYVTSTNGLGQLDLSQSEVQLGSLATDDVGYFFAETDNDDQLVSDSIPGSALPTPGNEVTDKVIIAITGQERVAERQWFTSAVLDFSGLNQRLESVAFSQQFSHIWESNATTLQTPYVNLNPNFRSRIVLTNTSNRDVTYEIFSQGEADINVNVIEEQKNGLIPANANLILFADELIEAFNGDGQTVNRASFSIVLAGPSDSLQGVVQFIEPSIGVVSQQTLLRPGTN